uniref:Uncharacterized protein n=1 Tax=Arundo donax TaxID=35708 RepID=A0A0A9GNF7_ARUDO
MHCSKVLYRDNSTNSKRMWRCKLLIINQQPHGIIQLNYHALHVNSSDDPSIHSTAILWQAIQWQISLVERAPCKHCLRR